MAKKSELSDRGKRVLRDEAAYIAEKFQDDEYTLGALVDILLDTDWNFKDPLPVSKDGMRMKPAMVRRILTDWQENAYLRRLRKRKLNKLNDKRYTTARMFCHAFLRWHEKIVEQE